MPYLFRIRSTVNSLRTLRSSRVGVILRDSLIALALFGLLAGLIGWHSAPVQVVPTGDVLANGTTASQLLRSGPNIPGTTAAINAVLSLPQLDREACCTRPTGALRLPYWQAFSLPLSPLTSGFSGILAVCTSHHVYVGVVANETRAGPFSVKSIWRLWAALSLCLRVLIHACDRS